MLRQILNTFENSPGPMSLDVLALQLDLKPAVLEGMLAELVRMGRLDRVDDRTESACAACGFTRGCPYVLSNAGTCYSLPEAAEATGSERLDGGMLHKGRH